MGTVLVKLEDLSPSRRTHTMPFTRTPLDPTHPDFQKLVGILRGSVCGPEPVSRDTDFGDIEDMAHDVGRAVAREICQQAAAEQAASAEQPEPCPECGRACDGEVAHRDLVTRDGPIALPEARHYCPRCRRAFFPQPTGAAADAPAVQPANRRVPGARRGGGVLR
jgi:hypothetical protein